jgi:hypothetical protein
MPRGAVMRTGIMKLLNEQEWRARTQVHSSRLLPLVEARRDRRARAQSHPVIDFLFTYYSFRPGQLMQWSPGHGVVLENAAADFSRRRHWVSEGGKARLCLASMSDRQRREVFWIQELLRAVTQRKAHFGCYGLHEWAMVYRQPASTLRHSKFPLRVREKEISELVESQPLCCTHYDAFRFFTRDARPLNSMRPTIDSRLDTEQSGCLHTNMDLYKWGYKLSPWIPSELLCDAFLLAMEIRELDMRASPYDLRSLGYTPVAVETVDGRAVYEREQRRFALKAEPIRARLLQAAGELAACLSGSGDRERVQGERARLGSMSSESSVN